MTEADRIEIGKIVEAKLSPTNERVEAINEAVGGLKVEMTEMHETLDANTASLIKIEQTFGAYGEMYTLNKERTEHLTERVDRIEKHVGLSQAA